jgi:hypothetical protein
MNNEKGGNFGLFEAWTLCHGPLPPRKQPLRAGTLLINFKNNTRSDDSKFDGDLSTLTYCYKQGRTCGEVALGVLE